MNALHYKDKINPVVKMVIDKGEVGDLELKVLMRKANRSPTDIDFLRKDGRITWIEERQCWIPGPRALDY